MSAPHPTRRLTKWTLTAACILIVLAWFPSRWFGAVETLSNGRTVVQLGVAYGALYAMFTTNPKNTLRGWHEDHESLRYPKSAATWLWRPRFKGGGTFFGVSMYELTIPLYIPLLLLSLPTAYLWLRRGIVAGHCPKCSYDLILLPPNSPCPECGHTQERKNEP